MVPVIRFANTCKSLPRNERHPQDAKGGHWYQICAPRGGGRRNSVPVNPPTLTSSPNTRQPLRNERHPQSSGGGGSLVPNAAPIVHTLPNLTSSNLAIYGKPSGVDPWPAPESDCFHRSSSTDPIPQIQFHRSSSTGPFPQIEFHRSSSTVSTSQIQFHRLNFTDSIPHMQFHKSSSTDPAPHIQFHRCNPTDHGLLILLLVVL